MSPARSAEERQLAHDLPRRADIWKSKVSLPICSLGQARARELLSANAESALSGSAFLLYVFVYTFLILVLVYERVLLIELLSTSIW